MLMCEFWYGEKATLCYMNTDSFKVYSLVRGHLHSNCKDVEKIAANMQTKQDNKAFIDISFTSSNCVITLVASQKRFKCKDDIVHFDPLRLFSRLISKAERTKKI